MLLGNSPVEQVHNTKLLSVFVDDRLGWTEHVNAICRKVGRKIGVLRRTSRELISFSSRFPLSKAPSTMVLPQRLRSGLLPRVTVSVRCGGKLLEVLLVLTSVRALRLSETPKRGEQFDAVAPTVSSASRTTKHYA